MRLLGIFTVSLSYCAAASPAAPQPPTPNGAVTRGVTHPKSDQETVGSPGSEALAYGNTRLVGGVAARLHQSPRHAARPLRPARRASSLFNPDHELDFRGCNGSTATADTGSSGAGITATAVNGATCSDEGMEFDGVDDWLDLTPWEFGGEPMTVEVYVKFDAFSNYRGIFEFHDDHTSSGNTFLARNLDANGQCQIGSVSSTSTDFLETGVWVHAVYTVDGSTAKLYKNGLLTDTSSSASEPTRTTRAHHYIGMSKCTDCIIGAQHRVLDGTIAYIRFWHGSALDADQVEQLHAERVDGPGVQQRLLSEAELATASCTAYAGTVTMHTQDAAKWDFEGLGSEGAAWVCDITTDDSFTALSATYTLRAIHPTTGASMHPDDTGAMASWGSGASGNEGYFSFGTPDTVVNAGGTMGLNVLAGSSGLVTFLGGFASKTNVVRFGFSQSMPEECFSVKDMEVTISGSEWPSSLPSLAPTLEPTLEPTTPLPIPVPTIAPSKSFMPTATDGIKVNFELRFVAAADKPTFVDSEQLKLVVAEQLDVPVENIHDWVVTWHLIPSGQTRRRLLTDSTYEWTATFMVVTTLSDVNVAEASAFVDEATAVLEAGDFEAAVQASVQSSLSFDVNSVHNIAAVTRKPSPVPTSFCYDAYDSTFCALFSSAECAYYFCADCEHANKCNEGCDFCSSPEPTAAPIPSPTLNPTLTPTLPPSEQPTKLPSKQPTPKPTEEPTPKPTVEPTQSPKPTPSGARPSPDPTLIPVPNPTASPTANPTPYPSLNPTSLPTTQPTPVPTVSCVAGEYVNITLRRCEMCPEGRFSNDTQTGVRSNFTRQCERCPIGLVSENYHFKDKKKRVGSTECVPCDKGTFENDRKQCIVCPAGTWINKNLSTCVSCELGRYAEAAAYGKCADCGSGFHTNGRSSAATSCDGCIAGKVAKKLDVMCSNCIAGWYSPQRAANCSICDAGKFSEAEGTPVCSKCDAGKSTNGLDESTVCTDCKPGTFAGLAYASCENCGRGKEQPESKQASCNACPDNEYSAEGSSNCTQCKQFYYYSLSTLTCEKCPLGTTCKGDGNSTSEKLFINSGYWRGTNKDTKMILVNEDESSDVIHQCPLDVNRNENFACKGGLNFDDDGGSYCAVGYTGPLCAVCEDGYFLNADDSICEVCKGGFAWKTFTTPIFVILFSIIGLFVFGFIAKFLFSWNRVDDDDSSDEEDADGEADEEALRDFADNENLKPKKKGTAAFILFARKMKKKVEVRVKAFTSFSQISVNVGFNCSIRFPKDMERATSSLSIFNLNIMPNLGVACHQARFDYIHEMVALTLTPIALSVILFLSYKFEGLIEHIKISKLAKIYPLDTDRLNELLDVEMADTLATPNEITSFRAAFDEADKGRVGKGTLERTELLSLLESVGHKKTRHELNIALRAISSDKQFSDFKHLTFTEFVFLMKGGPPRVNENRPKRYEFFRRAGLDLHLKRTVLKAQSYFCVFLIMTYLILVSTSSKIFYFFSIHEFPEMEGGTQKYLYKDYRIDCNSQRYKDYVPFAVMMIFIYPIGIPLIYYVSLHKCRHILTDPKELIHEAQNEKVPCPRIGHVNFLCESFKPEFYHFEVIDCSRRLFLGCVVGLIGGAMAPVCGVVVSAGFIYVFMQRPFREEDVCTLSIILQYSMLLIFMAALMISADISDHSEEEQKMFEVLCVVFLFIGPMAIAIQTTITICRWCCSKKESPLSADAEKAAATDDASKTNKEKRHSKSGALRNTSLVTDASNELNGPMHSHGSTHTLDPFSLTPSMFKAGTPLEGTPGMRNALGSASNSSNPWAAVERFDTEEGASGTLSPTTSTKMQLLEQPFTAAASAAASEEQAAAATSIDEISYVNATKSPDRGRHGDRRSGHTSSSGSNPSDTDRETDRNIDWSREDDQRERRVKQIAKLSKRPLGIALL